MTDSVVWHPTEEPPSLEQWLSGQVREAIGEYVERCSVFSILGNQITLSVVPNGRALATTGMSLVDLVRAEIDEMPVPERHHLMRVLGDAMEIVRHKL